MSTLASYTFPAGTDLTNRVVRGYATGRYLNNSGGSLSPVFTSTCNGVILNTISPAVATSTAALGWEMYVHFYFTQPVTSAGNQPSCGATTRIYLGNQGTQLTLRTSSYVAAIPFQVYAKPFINFVDLTAQVILSIQFTQAGSDTLETGCAYLEAL